jgi:NAD(P)-dependent dehydrogenase (short-subunit alcohol dehydrogenase family)
LLRLRPWRQQFAAQRDILVTGASRGIGRGCALELAKRDFVILGPAFD